MKKETIAIILFLVWLAIPVVPCLVQFAVWEIKDRREKKRKEALHKKTWGLYEKTSIVPSTGKKQYKPSKKPFEMYKGCNPTGKYNDIY